MAEGSGLSLTGALFHQSRMNVLRTLFLNPPSFDGFDGGAGARYQARREVRSFWYPTWIAQPAAMIEGSRLVDAPPHDLSAEDVLAIARDYELIILHTSTPTLAGDARLAEMFKSQQPGRLVGFVGAQAAVMPEQTLAMSEAIDFAAGREFDFTCLDIARGVPLADVPGITWRDRQKNRFIHNAERELIRDFDALPTVFDVYKRDLDISRYAIGYLRHPYVSHYTGRGCPAQCTFCLWPQTVGGHSYRAKSPDAVAAEMAYAHTLFPEVKEFFFDDDTFTAIAPRAREVAVRLGKLGMTWSCNARANVSFETLQVLKENGLRLLLVGYESGAQAILDNIKKGVRLEEARRFTRDCHRLGITIHGTFILGLPGETRETIQRTIAFAKELDIFSIQVSLAAPYPGTELHRQAVENGWLADPQLVGQGGQQLVALNYRDLSADEIFHAVEQFYNSYYFRLRVIGRIGLSMLRDVEEMKRRFREGWEFLRFMKARRTVG